MTFTPDDDADDLDGGISGTYTPTADDVGKCLRAMASYTDPQGSDTAMSVLTDSDQPVEADDTNKGPEFPDQDMETDGGPDGPGKNGGGEHNAADEDIGTAVVATDPNMDNLTYTLGGTDGASFDIDRGDGQLMTKAMLNKEAKDTYMVTVTATDPSGLSATINVTIKVTNVDEEPEITGGDTTVRYAEDRTDAVATYTAEDDEDDKAGKAITWSLSGTDGADFMISDVGVLTFVETPDYEESTGGGVNGTSPTYEVTVVATDGSSATDTLDVTVEVTNMDEDGTLTLLNRQPVDGVELATELTDIDGTTSAPTWKWEKSTSRSSGWVVIDGATDSMYTPVPADIGSYLRATVTYTDPQGSGKPEMAVSDEKVIATRSTNTAPVFRDADDEEIAIGTNIAREVAENAAAGTNVGAPVAAYDAQGDVLTYTLGDGADEASFDINQATGQIMVGAGTDLDLEEDPSYTVEVTATGPGHSDPDADTIEVTITVTNVEEDPELTGMDSLRPAENTVITGADASLGTYMAVDDEDGATNPALTLSGADASDFNLTDTNAAGGTDDDGTYELAFKAVPDYEMPADAGRNNVYNITITATDSDMQTDSKDVVVTVTNEEEAGTVTLNTLQPRVGIGVTATLADLDGAATGVTWAWEAQTATNCLSVSTFTPDDDADDLDGGISGTYTPTADDIGKCLRATASYTDPQGSDTAMSVLTDSDQPVEADDTNKGPEFPDQDMETDGDQTDQERTVAENTAAGQNIGTVVAATDPNMDNLTYTLGGTDGASFDIDRGDGQLMTKAMLNKEAKDTYMVTVTATDPSGLSATINVTIKVTNVDEDPVIMEVRGLAISGLSSIDYAENNRGAVAIYTASVSDAASAVWSLSGYDEGDFSISNAGVLTFRNSPDYEDPADADTNNVYMVTVNADDGTYMDTHDVTVTVTNADDPGTVTLWVGSVALTEPAIAGEALTGLVVDADGSVTVQSWQWMKAGSAAGQFADITGATLASYTPVEADASMYIKVMATYTDAEGSGKTAESPSVMVTVADVDEPGTVTLWVGSDPLTGPAIVGEELTGLVVDPDGGVTGEIWQWMRGDSATGQFADIDGATSASYTPVETDASMYIKVMATYTDAEGSDKTAESPMRYGATGSSTHDAAGAV